MKKGDKHFPLFKIGDTVRNKQWLMAVHKIVNMDDNAYYFENGGKVEICYQDLWEHISEDTLEH